MKILIIDDNANDRRLLRLNLEMHGCEAIIEARDGMEGYELAKAHKPDLIISDALMPGVDGYELLRMLKSNDELKGVPFVFHSSVYTGLKDRELALSLGAEAFIAKPKEPEELWEELSVVLKQCEAGRSKPEIVEPIGEEREYLKRYSQVVVSKLKEKVRELEETLTECTRAEQALKESEVRYRTLFEESIDGIFITSLQGKIIDISNTAVRMLGYDSKEEMLRLDLSGDVYVDPEDGRRILSVVAEKGSHEYELFVRKKSGEKMLARCAINAVRGADGAIIACQGVIRDISEQRKLEQDLFHAKKLEIIGQLAGGVAHEVRNPLNAILSISEALFKENEIADNPEYLPYIQHIRTQVGRLSKLMTDLLELGKPINAASIQPVSLRGVCAVTLDLWRMTEPSHANPVEFIVDNGAHDLRVSANGERLQQALLNLIENAAQHSPAGSGIILRIMEPYSQRVTIQVRDGGKGIAPEKIKKVFEPFFTTRAGGTGLGLSLVKHCIESMGGEARIMNNAPPPGCTAELVLSIASEGGETERETENTVD